MNKKSRKVVIRALMMSLSALAALLLAMEVIDFWQEKQYAEPREPGTEAFMQSGIVLWQGERYEKKPGLETILIAGIDREMNNYMSVGTSRYRNGGQADFLLLLVIDRNNEVIHQLLIDRDTITDVTILSTFGQETGTRRMQICLAHSYGASKDENARYTVKAVRALMNDIDIDEYYMMDLTAVAALSEALGGITVTVPDDMTAVNPLWRKGEVIALSGEEAVDFVRARKLAGEGTNDERMNRQSLFMDSAMISLRSSITNNADTAIQLLSSLQQNSSTTLSQQWIIDIIRQSASYSISPPDRLEGDYLISDAGYMEFHAHDGSAEEWIMRTLYSKLPDH